MPRLQLFFEAVCRTLARSGELPLAVDQSCGVALMKLVRDAHQEIARSLPGNEVQAALREVVNDSEETLGLAVQDALASVSSIEGQQYRSYLELFQPIARQALRRPGDAAGAAVPPQLRFAYPDEWLIFFPDRLNRFSAGDRPAIGDGWDLADLRGTGPFGESWQGLPEDPSHGASLLKFITDARTKDALRRHDELFRRVQSLEPMTGLVPLRSVHLDSDPPCLESAFVTGYDLGGLVRDWRWRDEAPKPNQVSAIIKRVAKTVGHLHQLRPSIVHRGLKPSNILLHPTSDGKVTIWVSDVGWGEVSSELASGIGDSDIRRLALRGSLNSLYFSPGQAIGRPADPTDDVYALGVIWFQMLKRDLTARPPTGDDRLTILKNLGLGDGHARLLADCLSPDPEERPSDGLSLAGRMDADPGKAGENASRSFVLANRTAGLGKHQRRTDSPRPPELVATPESKKTAPPAAEAPRAATPPKKATGPATIENSLGMTFVRVEPGTFLMGSPTEESGRRDWEGPQHPIRLTRPFYLGVFPVTQAQYEKLTGRNPSHHTRVLGGGPNHPVEQVSWNDALDFCKRLSAFAEEVAACRVYRLPTEAEWEYACRAGTTTPFSYGETVTLNEVHFFGLNAATWAKAASSAGKTAKVGDRPPNPWGLYDMHGNVMEWCQDWWSEDYYAESVEEDPPGPAVGRLKVARGGSFSQFSAECRSAARLGRSVTSRLNMIGFRVALTIPDV